MKKIICMLLFIQSGLIIAQTETVVTINGKKVQINPNALSTADNGLTVTNGNVQFGGSLIKPSVLTTSSTNTFAIQGLQTGIGTDELLTVDGNGVVKKRSFSNWDIKGNAGTSATDNFLGTTDNVDLMFRRNNLPAGRLGANTTSFGVGSLPPTTSGNFNSAFGASNLVSNTSGTYNIGIGYQVLGSNTTGSSNIGMGFKSLDQNISGNHNISLGQYALTSNTSGGYNVGVGTQALYGNTVGSNNVGLGYTALGAASSTGSNNSSVGYGSLAGLTTGDYNVGLGYSSGSKINGGTTNTNATGSVFIGSSSIAPNIGETNQIVIGYKAIGRGSNTVQIGNASMTSIGGQVAWSNPSDVRLKRDIKDSPFGLNFITKLRPVTYFMKSGPTELQTGFIAQEVEKAANDIGYEFSGVVKPQSNDYFYSLRYSEFVVPLVKAVQEQQIQIEEVKKEIALLKAKANK